jgi:hypothetical protein
VLEAVKNGRKAGGCIEPGEERGGSINSMHTYYVAMTSRQDKARFKMALIHILRIE